jgi:hypothetical protein
MRPLIPGCTALVTKGSKAGSEVTCIRHVGKPSLTAVKLSADFDCWEVDPPMPWKRVKDPTTTVMLDIFPTEFLMRIDGHEKDMHDQVHKILEKAT